MMAAQSASRSSRRTSSRSFRLVMVLALVWGLLPALAAGATSQVTVESDAVDGQDTSAQKVAPLSGDLSLAAGLQPRIYNGQPASIDDLPAVGDVQVALSWTGGGDLDLHVIDPSGEHIYWGNPQAVSGGRLDHDATPVCGQNGPHTESIRWPQGQTPSGTYEAWVEVWSGCPEPSTFQLDIMVDGTVVETLSGSTTFDRSDSVSFTVAAQLTPAPEPVPDPDPLPEPEPEPAPEPDDGVTEDPGTDGLVLVDGAGIRLLGPACADAPEGRFVDVSGAHQPGIDCIGWWGVTQGAGDATYGPGAPVTRGQMATFIARSITLTGGVLDHAPLSAFTDTQGDTHQRAIDQLAAIGVVGGVGGGRYDPAGSVTRAQMASFLARSWTARTGEELDLGDADFADIAGNVHADNIVRIASAGLTGGTSPGVYDPAGLVTRAQMGTFLARLLAMLVAEGFATYPPQNPVPMPERPHPDAGLVWTRVPHNQAVFGGTESQTQWMSSVTVGGPGLVAVGSDGDRAAVWISNEGVNWQRVGRNDPGLGGSGPQRMLAVASGGPGLVAVGTDHNAAAVWTSTDGSSWQRVPHDEAVFGGAELQTMNAVTVGGPGLVAVGRDGGRFWGEAAAAAVWTSTDGLRWQRIRHDPAVFGATSEALTMVSVTAGGSGLVAVGNDGTQSLVWTSTDGSSWQRAPQNPSVFGGAVISEVTAAGPGLVAVGFEGDYIEGTRVAAVWTSVDGWSWQQVAHRPGVFGGPDPQMMNSVTAAGQGVVAVGIGQHSAVVWNSPPQGLGPSSPDDQETDQSDTQPSSGEGLTWDEWYDECVDDGEDPAQCRCFVDLVEWISGTDRATDEELDALVEILFDDYREALLACF